MTTTRETVLSAVAAALAAGLPGVTVKRNAAIPDGVPEGALLILNDGEAGEPEVVMSPLTYSWERQAELVLLTRRHRRFVNDVTLDELVEALKAALDADTTFGGAVDWSEASAPATDVRAVTGAAELASAEITLTLAYDTSNPLDG